ncbi:helix-turn-helix transcriptional regulator [Curtobacterium sp. VKM Ac-1376]|uniref:helix-turn-helix transcriptional regulator n=1 Tax=Curtobacterium sp. VKM Ac-1376 TaxID=123312 RepID=UPI001E2B4081|nr:helix-turn-helix transcriptional regulator [Curtobacterium sp. VKM Ac-1376]
MDLVVAVLAETVQTFHPQQTGVAPPLAGEVGSINAAGRLHFAEALFDVAIGPVAAHIGLDGSTVDVARVLHRAIWRRFLPDIGLVVAAGHRQLATAVPKHASGLLTSREREVLQLVSEAYTNKEVAARLHIAPGTVKRHLANICDKLHAVSRLDAVRRAEQQRLL